MHFSEVIMFTFLWVIQNKINWLLSDGCLQESIGKKKQRKQKVMKSWSLTMNTLFYRINITENLSNIPLNIHILKPKIFKCR